MSHTDRLTTLMYAMTAGQRSDYYRRISLAEYHDGKVLPRLKPDEKLAIAERVMAGRPEPA